MAVIALFVASVLGIMIFPMLIPYLLLLYMALNGIASRQFINDLKLSIGSTNIFFPDLLYAAGLFLAFFGIFRLLFTGQLRYYAPLTKAAVFLTVCYFFFFVVKIVIGYFEGVPIDSLIRRFAIDTQCIYMFLPLFYLKEEKTLKQILYFVLLVTLLFPLAQPFVYGSADQVALEEGQGGTLRLGFGNANLFLMLGVLAFFVWERKIWLSALPLAGIAMLAQRSAFVAISLCIMVLSLQKKKSVKFIALMGVVGALLISTLILIQSTTSVPVVSKAAERFSQTFEKTGTTMARVDVIPMAFAEYAKRPFVGFTYREIHALKHSQLNDAFSSNMLRPHNFVLSSLLRSGTIGTVLLFCVIGLVMMAAYRLIEQPNTREQGAYLFSTLLFFVVFGLMNTSFLSAGFVFWVLAGIALWYLNRVHYIKLQRQREAR